MVYDPHKLKTTDLEPSKKMPSFSRQWECAVSRLSLPQLHCHCGGYLSNYKKELQPALVYESSKPALEEIA